MLTYVHPKSGLDGISRRQHCRIRRRGCVSLFTVFVYKVKFGSGSERCRMIFVPMGALLTMTCLSVGWTSS